MNSLPNCSLNRTLSQGHREPIPARWPPQLRDLVTDAWAQDAAKRPAAAEVAVRLRALLTDPEVQAALAPRAIEVPRAEPAKKPSECCVVS